MWFTVNIVFWQKLSCVELIALWLWANHCALLHNCYQLLSSWFIVSWARKYWWFGQGGLSLVKLVECWLLVDLVLAEWPRSVRAVRQLTLIIVNADIGFMVRMIDKGHEGGVCIVNWLFLLCEDRVVVIILLARVFCWYRFLVFWREEFCVV